MVRLKEDYSYNPLQQQAAHPAEDHQQTLAQAITVALESEYDATRVYDNILALASASPDATLQNLVRSVVSDIRKEEQTHIGQLTELLKVIDASGAINYIKGENEAKEQMKPSIDEIQ